MLAYRGSRSTGITCRVDKGAHSTSSEAMPSNARPLGGGGRASLWDCVEERPACDVSVWPQSAV